jgi:hypothetical protein
MERMPYCSTDVDDHDFLEHELSQMDHQLRRQGNLALSNPCGLLWYGWLLQMFICFFSFVLGFCKWKVCVHLVRVRNPSPPLNSVDLTKLVWGRSDKIHVTPPAPGAVLRSRRGSEQTLSCRACRSTWTTEIIPRIMCAFSHWTHSTCSYSPESFFPCSHSFYLWWEWCYSWCTFMLPFFSS